MRCSALRDDQWEKLKPLLLGKKTDPGRTAKNNRLFIDAVLYRYRVGIPWRDLPEKFGDFRVIHPRYCRWEKREYGQKYSKYYRKIRITSMR